MRSKEEDAGLYWQVHDWNLQVVAARAVERYPKEWPMTTKKRKREESEELGEAKKQRSTKDDISSHSLSLRPLPTKPHNPYEGLPSALQLNEPIDDFLNRLKPSSAGTEEPWLWCANFSSGHREATADVASFKQIGSKLLDNFLRKKQELERSFDPPKPAASITKMMNPHRLNLEEDIKRAAHRYHIAPGKWMLFPTPDQVDYYWANIVRATTEGRLGTAAKVATRLDKPQEPTQVICVYTKDFSDDADIKRVLIQLVTMKLAAAVPGPLPKGSADVRRQIWYKPDFLTYLDIVSGNEYKIKPTLYGTSSLLTRADLAGAA